MAKLKKLYIGTNLKMYKTIAETTAFLKELQVRTKDIDRSLMELFVIPSFTALESARKNTPNELILLGAQNMCWEDRGQFTGEVSPVMLKETGTDIIEIGHSERRHVFNESDQEINKKVLSSLKHGFKTLLCIGETGEQKELGVSDDYLSIQLKAGLNGVSAKELDKLWVAYEPVWAIGVNGVPASKEYADEKHAVIKTVLRELFGDAGDKVPVLYGGSVNSSNSEELIMMPNIDGLFIGRSAWDAENFDIIIRQVLPLFRAK